MNTMKEETMADTTALGTSERDQDAQAVNALTLRKIHYDYAYDRNPTEFISLYGEEIAPGATPTRFASSARALDLVPATLRAAIEKRHALHACFMDRAAPAAAWTRH